MESALTDFKVRRLCIIYTTIAYYTHIYIFCQEVIVFIKGKAAANTTLKIIFNSGIEPTLGVRRFSLTYQTCVWGQLVYQAYAAQKQTFY